MAMVMSHVAYTTNTLDYGNLVPFLNIFGLQFQFKNVLVFCRESRGVYAWEMLEKLKEKNHRWFFTDFLFLERWTLSRVKRKLENTHHSSIFTHFICCNIIRKFKRAKWKKTESNRTINDALLSSYTYAINAASDAALNRKNQQNHHFYLISTDELVFSREFT